MPFQYLNLRERGEALYRAGLDVGQDILNACDAADDLDRAEDALIEIGEAVGLTLPDVEEPDRITEAVKNHCSNLAKDRDAAKNVVKAQKATIQ